MRVGRHLHLHGSVPAIDLQINRQNSWLPATIVDDVRSSINDVVDTKTLRPVADLQAYTA